MFPTIIWLIWLVIITLIKGNLCAGFIEDEYFIFDEDVTYPGIVYIEYMYPIAINTATYDELRQITLLSDEHIQKIILTREKRHLKNKEDLLRIGITSKIVEAVASYITFDLEDSFGFKQRLRYSQRTADKTTSFRYYQQSELNNENTRIGFVSASDTLSTMVSVNNSYYLFHSSEGIINTIALGKYRLSLGQGIAYAPVFGFSKSSATITQPLRNYNIVRPHTSPFHQWSLEGAAAVVSARNIKVVPFYSSTKINSRLENEKIRTIYPFGEHNPEQKGNVTENILGLAVQYNRQSNWLIEGDNTYGLYLSRHSFDREFVDPNSSNDYRVSGLFFRNNFDRLTMFGEYTHIDNKKGLILGLRWGRTPLRQILIYRAYDDNIPVWHGNPFAAGSRFDNEKGVYYGLEIRPYRNTIINAYFDVWRYPQTSYFEKMPVTRSEQYLQVVQRLVKDRLRLRIRNKDYDKYRVIDDERKIRREKSLTTSFDWSHYLSNNITLSSGVEYINRYIREAGDFKDGMLFFNNVRWKKNKLDIMGQINVFNSEILHYRYEYSLRDMWETNPLSGDDIYAWLIGRLNVTDKITAESKIGWFYISKKFNFLTQLTYRL